MRFRAGVGMTPPKVLGAAKPTSSVMMSRMLGAPLGGTTRGGHQGLDWAALRSILPPNLGGGGGNCLPLMVVVASADPSTPVTCGAEVSGFPAFWAKAGPAARSRTRPAVTHAKTVFDGRGISFSFMKKDRLVQVSLSPQFLRPPSICFTSSFSQSSSFRPNFLKYMGILVSKHFDQRRVCFPLRAAIRSPPAARSCCRTAPRGRRGAGGYSSPCPGWSVPSSSPCRAGPWARNRRPPSRRR
jgi:hypothetical protein